MICHLKQVSQGDRLPLSKDLKEVGERIFFFLTHAYYLQQYLTGSRYRRMRVSKLLIHFSH